MSTLRTMSINQTNPKSHKKRPLLITILAIFFLISIPVGLFKAITLDKSEYQEDKKNIEELIKNGSIKYRDKTIYWKDKDDFQKKMIIKQLNLNKKALSNFFLYRIFKYLFAAVNIFFFYCFWNMKKWTLIVLIINAIFIILFNVIFTFFMHALLFVVPYLILTVIMYGCYRKRFIH